jgi:CRISPR/Cas system-associated protein Cas5 (RAMP superfamily)
MDKYGKQAIQNPKKNWDEEKEAKYLEELKTFYKGSSRKKKREEAKRWKEPVLYAAHTL